MIKAYYRLTKPGIIYGNLLPAIAGFCVASKGDIAWLLLFETLFGTSLVIASACVFNNYLDRGIDRKMERTKKRALATESISVLNALIFACLLLIAGSLILGHFTNRLTLVVSWMAVFMYVIVYGYFKRRSTIGTLVGAIPGAAPPVIGYTAAANQLDGTALLLFLIMFCWQMPHFYSIAIYRLKDYQNAGLPVFPARHGYKITKIHIILYIAAFTVVSLLVGLLGYESALYLIAALPVALYWLWLASKGWHTSNTERWARKMFGYSLLVLLVTSAALTAASFIS